MTVVRKGDEMMTQTGWIRLKHESNRILVCGRGHRLLFCGLSRTEKAIRSIVFQVAYERDRKIDSVLSSVLELCLKLESD